MIRFMGHPFQETFGKSWVFSAGRFERPTSL